MSLDALPCRHLATFTADTSSIPPAIVAGGPNGTRVVATVASGRVEGPALNADVVGGTASGDWVTIRASGTLSLDVRVSLRTDDGADLLLTYVGFGKPTGDGGLRILTNPRFETGDERYAWLNDTFCVAVGERTESGVRYEIYAVD
jgi:hypothetical protein